MLAIDVMDVEGLANAVANLCHSDLVWQRCTCPAAAPRPGLVLSEGASHRAWYEPSTSTGASFLSSGFNASV